jgi:hypothetical protein
MTNNNPNDTLPDDFKPIAVQGLPIFEGHLIVHTKDIPPFCVGDEVFGIGDGKKTTGEHCSICMSKKIIYAGTAFIYDDEWALFQIPNEYFTGLDLFNFETPHYLALINDPNVNDFFIENPDIPNKVRCVAKRKILASIA